MKSAAASLKEHIVNAKKYYFFHKKILSRTTVFHIDNNKKSIWKDHFVKKNLIFPCPEAMAYR